MKTKGSISLKPFKKINLTNIFQCLVVTSAFIMGGCSSLDRHTNTNGQMRGQAQSDNNLAESSGQIHRHLVAADKPLKGPSGNLVDGTNGPAAPDSVTTGNEQYKSRVPYMLPVLLRPQPGLRATPARRVQSCPAGSLRYCDHRKNRCSCVAASSVTNILQNNSRF